MRVLNLQESKNLNMLLIFEDAKLNGFWQNVNYKIKI